MKLSKLIIKLQEIEKEFGDLDVYETGDSGLLYKYEGIFRPTATKVYYQKWEDAAYMKDELTEGDVEVANEDLYDVDLSRPIKIGLLI